MLTSGGEDIAPTDLPDIIKRSSPLCESEQGLALTEASERDLIARTLKSCDGNVTATASALGLAKSTVYANCAATRFAPNRARQMTDVHHGSCR